MRRILAASGLLSWGALFAAPSLPRRALASQPRPPPPLPGLPGLGPGPLRRGRCSRSVYPFWAFDWSRAWGPQPALCGALLFLSGVLCSAAGIGGGGIYVSLLMVLGGLSLHDAVPLSKGIVFFGSLASLALNLRRRKKKLIHYGICRIVVPAALVGTLFGVW
ncbi:unnamed protein product, partial [Effrenium voratum]